jgi:hypothetical protein
MPSVEGIDDDVPPTGFGVYGLSTREWSPELGYSVGVIGRNTGEGFGVVGEAETGDGVVGRTSGRGFVGVSGYSPDSYAVYALTITGIGVTGISGCGYALYGTSYSGTGVYGSSTTGLAALLQGNVRIIGNLEITGNLQKGGGSFKIDHPLDPANKYLSHSFVESPDMKNVYDGVVVLDNKGEAVIELPDWFGALNKDFRYQLTAIGAPAPNLYIAEEISDDAATTSNYNNNKSRFKIAGGTSGMKVSWQVTGIRKDPWANTHRIRVEEDKPAKERGYYTYPDLYGEAAEKGINRLLFPREEEEQEKKELLLINDKLT